MIIAGIIISFGVLISGLLVLFQIGPFLVKLAILLISVIVAVIVAAISQKGE